jgi:intein-encoded DNA endonuclease-like protein
MEKERLTVEIQADVKMQLKWFCMRKKWKLKTVVETAIEEFMKKYDDGTAYYEQGEKADGQDDYNPEDYPEPEDD